ncbi:hypothetical protein N657DRAFT_650838 [Parathielavia appendiculata]|uniref:Uncharacterized protein n=1 Tax=Parathielavia appendiculata TaxID=2587402 RepID=A0AAN6YYZ6_9PEZI|nr:hypothetical protein N657DRAFT_650838 [Parathielavia appendiculata]
MPTIYQTVKLCVSIGLEAAAAWSKRFGYGSRPPGWPHHRMPDVAASTEPNLPTTRWWSSSEKQARELSGIVGPL